MQRSELRERAAVLARRYAEFEARGLSLDMTRGKPCPEQLDLSAGLLTCLGPNDYRAADGTDCRNYGVPDGLPEARRLFAEILEVEPSEVIVAGNSSLAIMHDAIVRALLCGVPGGDGPWRRAPSVKFLCPSPGYDRHFTICERFGIEMITVAMLADGPDMDAVERLAGSDPTVKGIWCVPRYSNPTGVTFSDSVVEGLVRMQTAAADFRIFWDDAYAVHHLTDEPDRLGNLLDACKSAGVPDRVLVFASMSKITFPAGGLAAVAGSATNIAHFRQGQFVQTIGPDKLNQLRHVRFLGNRAGIERHMRRHAAIIKPKFDAVLEILERELGGTNAARWSRPNGGYFLSVDTLDGAAAAVVARAARAGVKLTPAGATFPYGRDPRDRNIRLAPTFPSLDEIRQATELFCICVLLEGIERLLASG
jgi:DNA-binding transcriptional MocR family regulator